MKSRLIAISICCFLLNCENEPLGSSTDMNNNPGTSENFVPRSGYWVYDVNSISEFDSEMNIPAQVKWWKRGLAPKMSNTNQ